MTTAKQSVAVVGGGIVGICSAISLLEAGNDVTLIDRDDPGQATSYGNAGIISPWSIVPQAMPGIWKQIPGMIVKPDGPASVSLRHSLQYFPWLMRFLRESKIDRAKANSDAMHLLCGDAVTLYRDMLRGTGHEDLIVDAMYVHAFRNAQDADLDALGFQMRSEKGAELDLIGAADLRDLEPALSHDFQAAVLIKGQARARNPGKIGSVLTDKILRLGGTVLRADVQDLWPMEGAWNVTSSTGTKQYDKVVLAAGIWSTHLLKKLGVSVPLAAERGYHVSYTCGNLTLNNSVMDTSAHAVASSMENGLRVAGMAEFSGIDEPPDPKRIRALEKIAISMVPALRDAMPQTWMGMRPSFPDSLPIIQEFVSHPGLIGAFGHSHYGLMMAPKTGRIVADIVEKRRTNIDLSAFGVERFKFF